MDFSDRGGMQMIRRVIKTGDRQVEPDFGEQHLQLFQFHRKRFAIPTSPFSQFVIGQAVGAQLSI